MTDENIDTAKGRVKEAAGALTANKRMKNEGRADQAKGSAKKAANKIIDTLAGRKNH
jgi:uncharacterized protein YjbJ (UPF0337 family)